MIKTFRNKETENVSNRAFSKQLPGSIQQIALRKIRMLDSVIDLRDLVASPSNRLEKLKGERKEQYSIRINDQWRICFKWQVNNAYDVEIADYY